MSSLSMKINVKLGGSNAFLSESLQIDDMSTIVFGADVTHPLVDDDLNPSIAALVANIDPQWTRFVSCVRRQKSRKEVMHDLEGMVLELLKNFVDHK